MPEERTTHLSELYFDIAEVMVKGKPQLIDFKTSLAAAFEMISHYFDVKNTRRQRRSFRTTGRLDDFRSALRTGEQGHCGQGISA